MLFESFFTGIVLLLIAAFCVLKNKLTLIAAITGFLCGMLIFAGAGWPALLFLATFFLLGTWATSVGKAKKERLKLSATDDSRRTTFQVIANAGVATVLSIFMLLNDTYDHIVLLMIAASFASAAADTVSSELGNLFGTRYFNIITLRKDERGKDGVVSVEGTLLGIAGSAIIGLCYFMFISSLPEFLIIVIAGTIGNIVDSILGATAQRKQILTNNGVNFLNTLAGASVAFLLSYLWL